MKKAQRFSCCLALWLVLAVMLGVLPGTGKTAMAVPFVLDANGTSHVGWIFDTSDWTAYNSSPYHIGDDYYADDWVEDNGNTGGQNARAMAPGTVIYAGPSPSGWSYGNQVVVQCSDNSNFAYRYAHLEDVTVTVGQPVNFTTLLGHVGGTPGFSPHLHCVLYKNIYQMGPHGVGLDLLRIGKSPSSFITGAPDEPSQFAANFYNDGDEYGAVDCTTYNTLEDCDAHLGVCAWYLCADECHPVGTPVEEVCPEVNCTDYNTLEDCDAHPGVCAWYLCADECHPVGTPIDEVCPDTSCSDYTTLEDCDAHPGDCAWYFCADECHPTGTPIEEVCPVEDCTDYNTLAECDAHAGLCAWYLCADECHPVGTPIEEVCPEANDCITYPTVEDCDAHGGLCAWYFCADECHPTGTPIEDVCPEANDCITYPTVEECDAHGGICAWYFCADECHPVGTPIEEVCAGDYCTTYMSVEECDAYTGACAWYFCADECHPVGTPIEDVCPSELCITYTSVEECDAHMGVCAWYFCADECHPTGTPIEDVCPEAQECTSYTTVEECDAHGGICAWYACADECHPVGTPVEDVCPQDSDNDGVVDVDDNCPDTYNPDQIDFDNDLFGAACDCDDVNPLVNPAAIESQGAGTCADGLDNDCDGLVDTDPECTGECFVGVICSG